MVSTCMHGPFCGKSVSRTRLRSGCVMVICIMSHRVLGWLWAARMVDRYSATLAWKETDCGCPRTYQNRQGKGLSLVISCN